MAGVLLSGQPGPTVPAPILSGRGVDLPQAQLQTTTHLISIPARSPSAPGQDPFSPQNAQFVVNIIHLRDSLAVWVGSAPRDVVERARRKTRQSRTGAEAEAGKGDADALDRELADAMRQAGRLEEADESEYRSRPPCGSLATEWAVVMSRPGQSANEPPLGSSLFRTNADVALPMSQRLAARMSIPQLFLSLDLPPSLISHATAMMPAPPERTMKMMLLERGIADAIRAGVRVVEERKANS
ncbi:unnamed protein product [Tilletia controversa]|nr:unnamed protein product [Tilletia controversa]CAD6914608.1 unnamed protein product [Tilletia caries]CAD6936329.1 unnamed protein product [Tilletia controversa]CAD6962317.1 unnamed protein product [Tilletia controversa]CAD6971765.1 unnamed protein product [Tilletia controversa]